MTRRVTPDVLAKVKQWEGYRGYAYDDFNPNVPVEPGNVIHGTLTIGYGSTGPHVKAGDVISKAAAHHLLKKDLQRFEAAVDEAVNVDLTDGQFGALVSFAFNVGVGAFKKSTLLRKLNAGDYQSVPEELGRWVFSKGRKLPGLAARRAAEAGMWSSGDFVSSRHVEPAAPSQKGSVAASGGVGAVGASAVADAVAQVERAGDAMSMGSVLQCVVGVVILIGAGYVLYRIWDKAGRPKPWA